MGHFIDKFSSVLSGPGCPVAVDDYEKRVRYEPKVIRTQERALEGCHPYLITVPAWQDYPESHHLK